MPPSIPTERKVNRLNQKKKRIVKITGWYFKNHPVIFL